MDKIDKSGSIGDDTPNSRDSEKPYIDDFTDHVEINIYKGEFLN